MANLNESLKNMQVKDLKVFDEVIFCEEGTSIKDAVAAVNEINSGSIVVVDSQGKTSGIFTERDLLRKVSWNSKILEEPIDDHMSLNPKTVKPEDKMQKLFSYMRLYNFRHLVVVDDDHKPIGVISMRDAFNYMYDSVIEED